MLEELKENLQITWDKEDNKLSRWLESGKKYLEENIAGYKLDFESNEEIKELLFDYCRYRRNNCIEYFEENFMSKLLRLQIQSVVNENEKA